MVIQTMKQNFAYLFQDIVITTQISISQELEREDEFQMKSTHIFIYTDQAPPRRYEQRIQDLILGDEINWNKDDVTTPMVSVRVKKLRSQARKGETISKFPMDQN